MRTLAPPLAACCVLLAAAGAPSPPRSQPAAPPTGYEHVEVRVAQFDVVVRDRSGRIVTGLGPADFSVVEDGAPLDIVAVDEWGRGEAPQGAAVAGAPAASPAPRAATGAASSSARVAAEPEKRSVVIVFDALEDTTALRVSQAKRAATRFVRTHLSRDDVAAVYQLDLSLRPLSGITSDPDQLARAIDKVAWMPASSLADDIAESVVGGTMAANKDFAKERLENQAATAASELDWKREHVYEALSDLAAVFQALPGRRILVLASPGFPMTTTSDITAQTGGFTPKFKELIRALAAYGVTVYALDTGADSSFGDAGKAIDWRVAVGMIGLPESILTDLGLDTAMTSGSASERRQFLGVIAAETGGRLLTATDLDRDFDTVQEESAHFYRIACKVPVTGAGDRYRKTLIRAKRPGLQVSARRGRYSDIVPLDRPKSPGAAAVDSLASYRPLAVRGVAVPLPGADPKKVPLAVVMEALGPVDIPTGASGEGSIDLEFHLVARAAEEIVARYDRSLTAKVPAGHIEPLRSAFRVEGRLDLVPGVYDVQGTVRIVSPPQLATWSASVPVPPPPKGAAPAFAGIVLSSDVGATSPLLSQPEVPAEALTVKPGVRVLPATGPEFSQSAPVVALFWLAGVPAAEGQAPKVDLGVHVKDAKDAPVDAPSKLLFFGPEPTGGYRGLVGIDLSKLAPGPYRLELTATPANAALPPAKISAPVILEEAPRAGTALTSSASP